MLTLEERGLRYHRNLRYTDNLKQPKWGTLTVELRGGTKYVTYTNKLYQNKKWELSICFSEDFTNNEILQSVDVWDWLTQLFGEDGLI